jgi:hypothetical protein
MRNVISPTFSGKAVPPESEPQGKPTEGRVKERGESKRPEVMSGIATESELPPDDIVAQVTAADFRVVSPRETR